MPSPSSPLQPPVAARLAGVALAVFAACAGAEVYKCVNEQGHVTYQEAPCAAGQKGGTVELKDPVAARPGINEAAWSQPAREGRVVVGMPKPFVTEAIGKPGEIRAPRAGETGSEVWVYPRQGQPMRVGFNDGVVAWIRNDGVAEARPGAASTPSGVDRESRVREALQVGRPCAAALQDAGPADREEPLVAGTARGARYVYAFDPANANAYAAFVCLAGRITSVERYLPEARAGEPRAAPR